MYPGGLERPHWIIDQIRPGLSTPYSKTDTVSIDEWTVQEWSTQ